MSLFLTPGPLTFTMLTHFLFKPGQEMRKEYQDFTWQQPPKSFKLFSHEYFLGRRKPCRINFPSALKEKGDGKKKRDHART